MITQTKESFLSKAEEQNTPRILTCRKTSTEIPIFFVWFTCPAQAVYFSHPELSQRGCTGGFCPPDCPTRAFWTAQLSSRACQHTLTQATVHGNDNSMVFYIF